MSVRSTLTRMIEAPLPACFSAERSSAVRPVSMLGRCFDWQVGAPFLNGRLCTTIAAAAAAAAAAWQGLVGSAPKLTLVGEEAGVCSPGVGNMKCDSSPDDVDEQSEAGAAIGGAAAGKRVSGGAGAGSPPKMSSKLGRRGITSERRRFGDSSPSLSESERLSEMSESDSTSAGPS